MVAYLLRGYIISKQLNLFLCVNGIIVLKYNIGVYIEQILIIDIRKASRFDRTPRCRCSHLSNDVHAVSNHLTNMNDEIANLIAKGNICCILVLFIWIFFISFVF